MSMTAVQSDEGFSDFSITEWERLNKLSLRFDQKLKVAHTRMIVLGDTPYSRNIVKDTITDCVVETAHGTARVYGMEFDPPKYKTLVNDLTTNFIKVVRNEGAKDKVRAILPTGISFADRGNRLNVFGLSAPDAVRLERMRQKGISGRRLEDARLHMRLSRGNTLALTEVNRIINQTVESVWLNNVIVQKNRKDEGNILLEHAGRVTAITSLYGIPALAKKTVVTRRDNRTCDYCWPLEGITAGIGAMFQSRYGVFAHPPFHPRCRCFMIVRY